MKLLPKAELHVHIEGTITPALAQKLATRNKVSLSDRLISKDLKNYHWNDDGTAKTALQNFIHAYSDVSKCLKTSDDYTEITFDYLTRSAREGSIYCELMISSEMTRETGIPYSEMVKAVAQGIDKARDQSGIEARLINTAVRNYGGASALNCAQTMIDTPHPYVTGFGLAGDENAYSYLDFKPAFDLARAKGYGLTAHAGEAGGAENVRSAMEILGVKRFGHMVRAIEDDALMQELVKLGAVPEVCVSSNLFLKVYPSVKEHPLKKFIDLGLPVTIATDDPGFFNTTIGREYQIAQDDFGFTDDDLRQVTKNTIKAGFIDAPTQARLLALI